MRSRRTPLLLAACLGLLAGCKPAASTTGSCHVDGDCSAGDICIDSACVSASVAKCGTEQPCANNLACKSQVCDNGCCLPSCTTDANCPSGTLCSLGSTGIGACMAPASTTCAMDSDCTSPSSPHCQTATGICVACLQNADCPTGDTCTENACLAPMNNGMCTTDAQCTTFSQFPHCLVSGTSGMCVACVTNSQCPPSDAGMVVCSQTTNACEVVVPGCGSNSDCSAPTPVCRPDRVCVACTANSDCSGGQVCLSNNTCAAPGTCVSHEDCSEPTGACDTTTGMCVQCLANLDCVAGSFCSPAHTCYVGCTSNASCEAMPGTPICITGTGLCVQCLQDLDCPAGGSCSPTNTCAGCMSNADCVDVEGKGICDSTTMSCVACLQTSDCPAGHTCSASNACVGCMSNMDCAAVAGMPVCNVATGECGAQPCTSSAECTGGLICAAAVSPSNPGALSNQCITPVNPGAGAVGAACTSNLGCQSGHCIGDVPSHGFCQGGCSVDTDCTATGTGACASLPITWTDSAQATLTTSVASCVAQCTSQSQCGEGTGTAGCTLIPNNAGNGWATICSNTGFNPAVGKIGGGGPCSANTDCISGVCDSFSPFGGICIEFCGTTASPCDSLLLGAICPADGVMYKLPNGTSAVAHICWGPTCSSATDCEGSPADATWTCSADHDPAGETQTFCEPLSL